MAPKLRPTHTWPELHHLQGCARARALKLTPLAFFARQTKSCSRRRASQRSRSVRTGQDGGVRALVKTKPGPGLELTEVPIPGVGLGDVLVKVKATGICGTDLHIDGWDPWARRTLHPPLTVGHEFSGEVVDVGSAVTDVAVGDLISGEGHLVCGRCRNCRAERRHLCIDTRGIGVHLDGAFAEYVTLPATNVWVHRELVSAEVAAIFDP